MKYVLGAAFAVCVATLWANAEPVQRITIDGNFTDWQYVPAYSDPVDDQHDTNHSLPGDTPLYVDHQDVDLIEFKMTHDENNLYAYFRATGEIGRTLDTGPGIGDGSTGGRYYVIVTIDVDQNDTTGYPLHEGGYFPTTPGYDVNMEVEFFDGEFNTGHYLNHGCLDNAEFLLAQSQQSQGFMNVKPGTYDWYTQWVWWDTPQGIPGEIELPPGGGSTIVWVSDKGPIYQGIITIALSPDNHEAEMCAPFRGFMHYPNGTFTGPDLTRPIIGLGSVLDASFSLEASGQLAVGNDWASDTADPLNGYVVSPPTADFDGDGLLDGWEADNLLNPYDDGSTDPNMGGGGDPDGDGFTNSEEQAFGSDPQNINDFPTAVPLRGWMVAPVILLAALVTLRFRMKRRTV